MRWPDTTTSSGVTACACVLQARGNSSVWPLEFWPDCTYTGDESFRELMVVPGFRCLLLVTFRPRRSRQGEAAKRSHKQKLCSQTVNPQLHITSRGREVESRSPLQQRCGPREVRARDAPSPKMRQLPTVAAMTKAYILRMMNAMLTNASRSEAERSVEFTERGHTLLGCFGTRDIICWSCSKIACLRWKIGADHHYL